ncbi:MAG: VOC family protein [Clostridiales bacterium]|nr:VOC family protein [Clostridiales bacterium]
MKLSCINISTTQPIKVRDFYSLVLKAPFNEIVPNRFEISVDNVTIVVTPSNVKVPVNPDCCGLEFYVDDVDAEYERLLASGVQIDNPPVTYPWNYRAIGFKDPDGNNIDFVSYVGQPKTPL